MNSYRWKLLEPKPLNGDESNFCLTRDEHTACVMGDNMVVFGGFKAGERCNDIFQYNFTANTWENIKPVKGSPLPSPIAGHSACIAKCPETGNDIMIVFGGKDDENMKLNELWKFDFNLKTWAKLEPANAEHDLPMPRSGHSSILYREKYIAVFGGIYEITRELNDCFLYDIKNNKWFNLFEETGPASPKRLKDENSPRSTKKTGEIKEMTTRTVGAPIKGRRRKAKFESLEPTSTIVEKKEEKKVMELESPTSVQMKKSFIIQN